MLNEAMRSWLTAQLRLYIPLSDQQADDITAMFQCREISKGDWLVKEGHYGDWWGFVYKGLLRSFSCDQEENEYTNGFMREDSFTCEFVSFYGGAVSPTSVEALEDTTIICVNRQTLDQLFSDFPFFEKYGRQLYQHVLVRVKQQTLFRVRLKPRERYQYFLEHEPELIKRVPLKYIASYLSITDSSLSRIRRFISCL